jgi:hypothetical protein
VEDEQEDVLQQILSFRSVSKDPERYCVHYARKAAEETA